MKFIKYRAVFTTDVMDSTQVPGLIQTHWSYTHIEDGVSVKDFVAERDKVCSSLKNYNGTQAHTLAVESDEAQNYIKQRINNEKENQKNSKKLVGILEMYVKK
jgi:hypothetical protein